MCNKELLKKIGVIVLAGVTAFSPVASTVAISDPPIVSETTNAVDVDEISEDIDINMASIGDTSGHNVGKNSAEYVGTEGRDHGYIVNVSEGSTVTENYGDIKTNNGTVSNNIGDIETNNGTVTENNGDIESNEGRIATNNGTLGDNCASGIVANESTGNGVKVNDGTIEKNHGEILNNYGTVGELDENDDPVVETGNFGSIKDNYGTVSENNGTINNNHTNGVVHKNCYSDSVGTNEGIVYDNYGVVVINKTGGRVNNVNATGVVKYNKGGLVLNGIIEANIGGSTTGTSATILHQFWSFISSGLSDLGLVSGKNYEGSADGNGDFIEFPDLDTGNDIWLQQNEATIQHSVTLKASSNSKVLSGFNVAEGHSQLISPDATDANVFYVIKDDGSGTRLATITNNGNGRITVSNLSGDIYLVPVLEDRHDDDSNQSGNSSTNKNENTYEELLNRYIGILNGAADVAQTNSINYGTTSETEAAQLLIPENNSLFLNPNGKLLATAVDSHGRITDVSVSYHGDGSIDAGCVLVETPFELLKIAAVENEDTSNAVSIGIYSVACHSGDTIFLSLLKNRYSFDSKLYAIFKDQVSGKTTYKPVTITSGGALAITIPYDNCIMSIVKL